MFAIKYKKTIGAVLLLTVFALFLNYIFPPLVPKSYSQVIFAQDSTMLAAYLSKDDKWRFKTNEGEISPELVKAIIFKEDKWFYWHFGFNPISIMKAAVNNLGSGNRQIGASTITMQIARMLEPGERTYFKKIIEIVRAVQLELNYSKQELLEIYLSHIPMGGNIEGIKAASMLYFNKLPSKLSLAQSTLLTILPNNPNKFRLDKKNNSILSKRNYWLSIFRKAQLFPNEAIKDAMLEKHKFVRFQLPSIAPHFTRSIRNKNKDSEVYTTLSKTTQSKCEKLLRSHVARNKNKGISTGAVLVIDNRTNSIAAYCGSSDFQNSSISGQVDGIIAIRSPGSALKPFLYASGLQIGMITPKIRMLDIPTDFSSYSPENYEKKFNGSVTANYALVNSLNVPATRLLLKLGFNNFIELLKNLGFETIKKKEQELGLSTILGGCGVSLLELANAYTVFANNGVYSKVNSLVGLKSKSSNIFSAEATYLVSKMLSSSEREESLNLNSFASNLPNISWKTGTSYGKRDGWAIGYNGNYTVGIWMGNFNGKGSSFLSGSEIAVPLLFNIFNAIDYKSSNEWFKKPVGVLQRKVCKESGLPPSKFCSEIISDYYIDNVSTNAKCDYVKEYFVNEEESESYCLDCLPESKYKKKAYDNLAPELVLWYKSNGIYLNLPPIHNSKCKTVKSNSKLKIVSPSADYEYLIESNSAQKIMLLATSNNDVKEIYWYVNRSYFGKSNLGEKLFYIPQKGTNEILCIDDKGSESRVKIEVKYY